MTHSKTNFSHNTNTAVQQYLASGKHNCTFKKQTNKQLTPISFQSVILLSCYLSDTQLAQQHFSSFLPSVPWRDREVTQHLKDESSQPSFSGSGQPGIRGFYRAMLAQSAVMRLLSSVCPPVTIRYRDDIGWNSSKITSRPNSLRPLLWLTPTWAIWCNGNMGKFGED